MASLKRHDNSSMELESRWSESKWFKTLIRGGIFYIKLFSPWSEADSHDHESSKRLQKPMKKILPPPCAKPIGRGVLSSKPRTGMNTSFSGNKKAAPHSGCRVDKQSLHIESCYVRASLTSASWIGKLLILFRRFYGNKLLSSPSRWFCNSRMVSVVSQKRNTSVSTSGDGWI